MLNVNELIEGPLRPLHACLVLAVKDGGKAAFWQQLVLALPAPDGMSGAGAQTVRVFCTETLARKSPRDAVQLLDELLRNPNSGWADVELVAATDDLIGHALTEEIKAALLSGLGAYAAQWLTAFAQQLNAALAALEE